MRIQHVDGSQELHEELTAKEVLEKTKTALQDDTVTGIKIAKQARKRGPVNKAQENARREKQLARGMLKFK